ncbi:hypothetical protein BH23CHL1_BH23CHL1_19490 [soil metagenome]
MISTGVLSQGWRSLSVVRVFGQMAPKVTRVREKYNATGSLGFRRAISMPTPAQTPVEMIIRLRT